MKRINASLIALVSTTLFCISCSNGSEDVENPQITQLPTMTDPNDVCTSMKDANFMKYCYQNFDINGDKKVSPQEASLVKQISDQNLDVKDWTGIQFFSGLETLSLSRGNFTTIDLSHCKGLKTLKIKAPLTQLNLSYNKELQTLNIEGLDIKTIDISPLQLLKSFICKKCANINEIRLLYSQLDICTIDDGNNIHFIIADDPKKELKKTARITYRLTVSDKNKMVNASIVIKSGDETIESGNIINSTYKKTLISNALPSHYEYDLSAYYNGTIPTHSNSASDFGVSCNLCLSIIVDIFLDDKLKLRSETYDCLEKQYSSFYDNFVLVSNNIEKMQKELTNSLYNMIYTSKFRTIDIDLEGNIVAQ